MRLGWMAAVAAVAALSSATAQTKPQIRPPQEPRVMERLERFANDAEFIEYVRGVNHYNRRRNDYGGVADNMAVPMPPPSPPPPPATAAPMAGAVSSDSRAAAPSTMPDGSSITNVQTQGVDEGGIVKQVGRFLVILQDGRVFVADTGRAGQPGLSLASRTNVYRGTGGNSSWYDEMLVSGNRILVTGYSYQQAASEVTVFTIDDRGQLTREATYYISSNDYYDTENYATRLVNGNLVIYTPLAIRSINPMAQMRWPLVRRWVRDEGGRAVLSQGRPLFDADDIYKPVQRTSNPVVHSVSVCPLGDPRRGDELECRTTGFVGASQREFFVSTSDIYLWVTPSYGDGVECSNEGVPATLFQVPLTGAPPRAIHARGAPQDQFGLDASATEFRALLDMNAVCGNRTRGANNSARLEYLRVPFTALSNAPRQAPSYSYTNVPDPGTPRYEARFADTHLVYAAAQDGSSYPPAEGAPPRTSNLIVVPTTRPMASTTLTAPHGTLRIERAGAGVILTGYRTDAGLSVSALALGARPRITDTEVLNSRFEAENRSHAFNALVGREGNGIMGLPTVTGTKQAGRWVWRSEASDLSFLTINPSGLLNSAGTLTANANARHPSYVCEVSCVDWYGNSRAIFTGGRIFALSGTELVEGDYANGQVGETRRLNLSAPVGRR
jgi:hypothetical protein